MYQILHMKYQPQLNMQIIRTIMKPGKIIRKQKISVILNVQIVEYTTKEYRNRKTGARVHALSRKGM